MSKYFRPWNIDQTLLLPPSVQDFVPKDHVSRFIVGLVRETPTGNAIRQDHSSFLLVSSNEKIRRLSRIVRRKSCCVLENAVE
jgi:hypothetical protein